MSPEIELIDPKLIPESVLPLVVVVDDRRSFLAWLIKSHSEGNYNHCMMMCRPGYFASQDIVGYREVPVEKYMKNSIRLKFWQIPGLTEAERQGIIDTIKKDLAVPWWKWEKKYDFLGILGQLLHIPRLNDTWRRYCSERVRDYLKDIINLPIHPTPSEINTLCKASARMAVYGVWEAD